MVSSQSLSSSTLTLVSILVFKITCRPENSLSLDLWLNGDYEQQQVWQFGVYMNSTLTISVGSHCGQLSLDSSAFGVVDQ